MFLFIGSRREDDWTCPSCGNVNFSFRMTCNMRNCTQPRPADHNSVSPEMCLLYLDWFDVWFYLRNKVFSYYVIRKTNCRAEVGMPLFQVFDRQHLWNCWFFDDLVLLSDAMDHLWVNKCYFSFLIRIPKECGSCQLSQRITRVQK